MGVANTVLYDGIDLVIKSFVAVVHADMVRKRIYTEVVVYLFFVRWRGQRDMVRPPNHWLGFALLAVVALRLHCWQTTLLVDLLHPAFLLFVPVQRQIVEIIRRVTSDCYVVFPYRLGRFAELWFDSELFNLLQASTHPAQWIWRLHPWREIIFLRVFHDADKAGILAGQRF